MNTLKKVIFYFRLLPGFDGYVQKSLNILIFLINLDRFLLIGYGHIRLAVNLKDPRS